MPLDVPNLDDRSYDELRSAALERIQKNLDTKWTDLTPGDPGIVLLEAFSFLTEQLIYRLNRLPEKAFIAFLRMLGVSLHPPTAARVPVRFWLEEPSPQPTVIPKGTQILSSEAEDPELAPVFIVPHDVELPANSQGEKSEKTIIAYHCEYVPGELVLAESSGQPGQTVQISRPPIVANAYRKNEQNEKEAINDLEIIVGVSVPNQPPDRWIEHEGKIFRVWQEVDNFANLQQNQHVFTVDRQKGLIQFAPAVRLTKTLPPTQQAASQAETSSKAETAAPNPPHQGLAPDFTTLAAIPPAGSEIRVWYFRGGGESGNNILKGQLDTVRLVNTALRVSNLERSHSGLAIESLGNALVRGPQEVYALERAVTAEDFERVMLNYTNALARARAFDKAGLWTFADPGIVDIVMVPRIPNIQPAQLTAGYLQDNRQESALSGLDQELQARKTLGTKVEKRWARYKTVTVRATLVTRLREDRQKMIERLTERIRAFLSPLPFRFEDSAETNGDSRHQYIKRLYEDVRPFGQPLQVSEIYQLILDTEERQIGQQNSLQVAISSVELEVEAAPNRDVHALAADQFQPNTWYAGSGTRLFRSTNNGAGWEQLLSLQADEEIRVQDRDDSQQVIQLSESATIRHIETSPHRAGLVAIASQPSAARQADKTFIHLSATCGEEWIMTTIVHCQVEDMTWISWPSGNFLLLATADGLMSLAVSFAEDGTPQVNMAPELIPVFAREASYPLYAVTTIEGVRGSLVAVAARGRRGVYLATSTDLLTPKQAAAMMPTWQAAADMTGSMPDPETAVPGAPNPVQDPAAGTEQVDRPFVSANGEPEPFRTSPYFRYIGCVNEDVRHLNVQRVGNRLHLWAGVMAKADRGKGCYLWTFDPNPTLIRARRGWIGGEQSATWTGGSCYAVAFHDDAVFAVTAWGGVLRLTLDESKPLADQEWRSIERVDLPIRSYELSPSHEPSDEQTQPHRPFRPQGDHASKHVHLFLPLRAIASNNGTRTKQPPIVMVGGEQGVYLSRQLGNSVSVGEQYEHASRTVYKMLKDTITIPETWLLMPGEPEITILSAQEMTQASGA